MNRTKPLLVARPDGKVNHGLSNVRRKIGFLFRTLSAENKGKRISRPHMQLEVGIQDSG